MKFNFKNILCDIGLHKFKYYTEPHKIVGAHWLRNDGKVINVPIRECTRCKKRWHHMMPTCGQAQYNWKPFKHKPNKDIKIRQI